MALADQLADLASGNKVTQTGALTSVGSWIVSSEAGVIIGLIVGVSGLVMQWYFNRRRDKREQAEHEARMRGLE